MANRAGFRPRMNLKASSKAGIARRKPEQKREERKSKSKSKYPRIKEAQFDRDQNPNL